MTELEELRGQLVAYEPKGPEEEADREEMLRHLELAPDTILTRANETAHFTASAFVLSEDQQWVLMAHHDLYKVWAWLGGHADGEADLLAVARREAEEETGVTGLRPLTGKMDSVEILPVWGHWKWGKYVPSHLHLNVSYLFTAPRTGSLRPRPGENSKVAWLPVGDLLELTNEWQMDPIYQKLLERGLK